MHTVIDDHSRIAYAEIHDNETADTVIAVTSSSLARRLRRHHRTRAVGERQLLSVGSRTRACTELGTRAKHAHPTGHKPTARLNGLTALWSRVGRRPPLPLRTSSASRAASRLHTHKHHRQHTAIG